MIYLLSFFFFNDTATTEIYTLSLHDALPICVVQERTNREDCRRGYILDGFPRTTAQAAMLEKLAVEQGNKIQAVLVDTPADRKSTRLNSSHANISYAVFCLKKKNQLNISHYS